MQIFSGCVCHLEQIHAQSPFLFPIVFSINLIPFFDICSVEGTSPPAEVEKVFKNENLSPIHDDINVFSQKCSFLPKNNDGEES